VTATCSNSFRRQGGPRRFLAAVASCGSDGWTAMVLPGQKSSMVRSLVDCNALIELPARHQPLEAGSRVELVLI